MDGPCELISMYFLAFSRTLRLTVSIAISPTVSSFVDKLNEENACPKYPSDPFYFIYFRLKVGSVTALVHCVFMCYLTMGANYDTKK